MDADIFDEKVQTVEAVEGFFRVWISLYMQGLIASAAPAKHTKMGALRHVCSQRDTSGVFDLIYISFLAYVHRKLHSRSALGLHPR